jgi:formylglycine-generating enzyme required for sulfatase activity
VKGGDYYRTYTNDGSGPTGQADPATVSSFRLDAYLVTVGRFRQFVAAWNGGWRAAAGSGRHTHLNGGQGLADSSNPGSYETGWVSANAANVAPTDANLECYATTTPAFDTWTSAAGANESLPINCANWYEAYAFCIWDGGFLPSEAEWEYAGAGGSELREYPWGTVAPGAGCPGAGCNYAIYNCEYPSGGGFASCTGVSNIAPVGYASLGAARWGQFDLSGEIWEWVLDWYASYVSPCTDCAYLSPTGATVNRGGEYDNQNNSGYLLPTYRGTFGSPDPRSIRNPGQGLRCARVP